MQFNKSATSSTESVLTGCLSVISRTCMHTDPWWAQAYSWKSSPDKKKDGGCPLWWSCFPSPPPLFVCVRFINSSLLQPSLRRKRKGAHREPCFFSSGLFFSVLSAFHSSTYLLFRAKLLGLVIFVSSLPCWLLHLRSRSLTGRCCSHGFWCCVGIEAWLDGLSLFVLVNSSSALISYKTNNRSQWWVLLWP